MWKPAESAKHVATPKKKVENTTMSAVDAVVQRGHEQMYMRIGSPKNNTDPKRCDMMLTSLFGEMIYMLLSYGNLPVSLWT